MSYPDDRRNLNSRMVIDACIPWNKKKDWPAVVKNSQGLEKHLQEKFSGVIPKNWFGGV
jgi:3-polyprenyl-4-hydroxybenzoate decarboxylase